MPETMEMSSDFQMKCRHSNGNLHIRTRGVFDGNSAHELLNLLQEQYPGTGRVFVDTADLGEVLPFGCSLFRARLHATSVPAAQLFFKGEKGFRIAPDGSKVLIVGAGKKTNGCCGKCAVCTCGGKHCH